MVERYEDERIIELYMPVGDEGGCTVIFYKNIKRSELCLMTQGFGILLAKDAENAEEGVKAFVSELGINTESFLEAL